MKPEANFTFCPSYSGTGCTGHVAKGFRIYNRYAASCVARFRDVALIFKTHCWPFTPQLMMNIFQFVLHCKKSFQSKKKSQVQSMPPTWPGQTPTTLQISCLAIHCTLATAPFFSLPNLRLLSFTFRLQFISLAFLFQPSASCQAQVGKMKITRGLTPNT